MRAREWILVSETVHSVEVGVRWAPNVPDARLTVDDGGNAELVMNAHIDDADQRPVVLSWSDCVFAQSGAPNDEALHLHRLYAYGLSGIRWIGEVQGSLLIAALARMNARGAIGLRHHVLPMKENTVEIVAREGPFISRQDIWRR